MITETGRAREPGPIRDILVVGGGSSGWIAAAYLNRFLRRIGCRITLVESAAIPTIGVGEATIPWLVAFVRNMGIDEDEMMRRCHATYKLAIRFDNWGGVGHRYWHPFGLCGEMVDGLEMFHFWHRAVRQGLDPGDYWSYSLQVQLAKSGRAPRPVSGTSPIIKTGTYAYHLDASALAEFLRDLAVREGVRHVVADVHSVGLDEQGFITHVDTSTAERIESDFFIDCTGFAARLAEKALGDRWIDWSDTLLCDRAVTVALPPDQDLHPFTAATALEDGWVWRIPLSHRTGTGYVFSSAHVDDERAASRFLESSGADSGPGPDPRFLEMRVGRRSRFWQRNCIAIGLASGFVEPLESTGLYLAQAGLEHLMDLFPDQRIDPALVERYNSRMATTYEEVRDFVLLHYLIADRNDTDFWRDTGQVAVPDSLRETMALYDETGRVDVPGRALFRPTNYHFIFAGNGRLPRREPVQASLTEAEQADSVLARVRDLNREVVARLPSHRTLTERAHRA